MSRTQQDHDDAVDIICQRVLPELAEFLLGPAGFEYWNTMLQVPRGELDIAESAYTIFSAHMAQAEHGTPLPPSEDLSPYLQGALASMLDKGPDFALPQCLLGMLAAGRIDPTYTQSHLQPCAMAYALEFARATRNVEIYEEPESEEEVHIRALHVTLESLGGDLIRNSADGSYAVGLDNSQVQSAIEWVLEPYFPGMIMIYDNGEKGKASAITQK